MIEVVRELVSACRGFKVEIRRRPDDLYEVACFRWYEEKIGEYCVDAAGWAPETGQHHVVLTGSLRDAERLADEELARLSRVDT